MPQPNLQLPMQVLHPAPLPSPGGGGEAEGLESTICPEHLLEQLLPCSYCHNYCTQLLLFHSTATEQSTEQLLPATLVEQLIN